MRENIFIAWSGKSDYAKQVGNKLSSLKFNPIIGGDINNDSNIMFIGQTIISQMEKCSQAIILVQKKNNGIISSNLMFEFGYLLRKLSYDKIHVFFIDISEADIKIPSDIRGIWANFLSSNEENFLEKITSVFLQRQSQIIKEDKLDIIINWNYYKNLIKLYCSDPQYTGFEMAQYLLFYMQAVYFNEDYEETIDMLNELYKSFHSYQNELQSSLRFCKITLKFYRVFYSKINNKLTKEETTSILYDYEDLLEHSESLTESEFKCWLLADILEHLGFLLYYYLLFTSDVLEEQINLYEKIIEYNKRALFYLNELTSGKYASEKNIYFSSLFKAYVYRQEAHAHRFLYQHGNLCQKIEEHKCFINSFNMRKILYDDFPNIKVNNKVLENMELDYYLSMSEILYYPEFTQKKTRYYYELDNYLNRQKNKCNVISEYIHNIETNIKGEL